MVVASFANLRADLFAYLTGHPVRYFSQHFSGPQAIRISSAGARARLIVVWHARSFRRGMNFIGAVVLCRAYWHGRRLIACVLLAGLLVTFFGIRGRKRHIDFALQSVRVGPASRRAIW
ncbi:hypothetical protein [Pseudomonas ogarae]|jgi:ATP-binding cassette subfamily B protein